VTGPAEGVEPAPEPSGEPAAVVGTPEAPAGSGGVELPERPPIGIGRNGRRLGWIEFVVGAVVYVAVQIGAGGIAVAAFGRLPGAPGLLAISAASAFAAVLVAAALRVRTTAALGLRRVPLRSHALAVIGVWLLSRVLIVVYISITGDHSDPQQSLTQFAGFAAAFWVVLLGGLVVPLGEELLFRGVGYGSMRRYGPVVATIVSSLVFAVAHGFNVVFLAVLVLAVLNSVLYERTRSIWPCFITHASFNLCSFVILLLLA
jgi:membrane protease YdiL (CAAX protease family)